MRESNSSRISPKLRWVVIGVFILIFVLILTPFIMLPLAFKYNRAPSMPLGVFHNYVQPVINNIDNDNPYKKLWNSYVVYICNINAESCDVTDSRK